MTIYRKLIFNILSDKKLKLIYRMNKYYININLNTESKLRKYINEFLYNAHYTSKVRSKHYNKDIK